MNIDNYKIELTLKEIILRLTGNIQPVGESHTDEKRFENLKILCDLVNDLVTDIDRVGYENKDCAEFSRKRASEYAQKFMTEILGISD